MAYLAWDEKYSVGVKEIDAQHQKLIDLVNQLHEAMKQGKGKDIMSQVLQTLINYTATHFGTEEKYMTAFNYPQFSLHKMEHEKFVKKVLDFQKDYNSGKLALTIDIMNFLKDWLVSHIQGTDKKFGPFFNENGLA
ncbi:MAG TPA: bacteriohemerythrin [Desulfobacteria bacterium]|nr:bacteriohemerythrin [Desulfobacteria bacterium]